MGNKLKQENIRNFLYLEYEINNVENSPRYKPLAVFVYSATLIAIAICEILWYVFNLDWLNHNASVLDVCMAGIHGFSAVAYFILGLCTKSNFGIYISYGTISLITSIYMMYMSTRTILFADSEFLGFIGIGVWIATSVFCIYGVFNNIKHDRYRKDNPNMFKTKCKNDEVFCMVITKITLIQFAVPVLEIVCFAVIYTMYPEKYHVEGGTFATFFHFLAGVAFMAIGIVANFAWKLIIKAYYEKKLDREKVVKIVRG